MPTKSYGAINDAKAVVLVLSETCDRIATRRQGDRAGLVQAPTESLPVTYRCFCAVEREHSSIF